MFLGIEPVEAHRGFVVPSGGGWKTFGTCCYIIGPGKRTKPIIFFSHRHTFIFVYIYIYTYTLLWLSCFRCECVWICVKFNYCMSSIFFVRGLPHDSQWCRWHMWKILPVEQPEQISLKFARFFSMTKVNRPNHPCWTIFSLKMFLYAKLQWTWLYVWQPQNKTQALPVISAARKHVRLQQCWWWWFVITDLRAGRLWSLATSINGMLPSWWTRKILRGS